MCQVQAACMLCLFAKDVSAPTVRPDTQKNAWQPVGTKQSQKSARRKIAQVQPQRGRSGERFYRNAFSHAHSETSSELGRAAFFFVAVAILPSIINRVSTAGQGLDRRSKLSTTRRGDCLPTSKACVGNQEAESLTRQPRDWKDVSYRMEEEGAEDGAAGDLDGDMQSALAEAAAADRRSTRGVGKALCASI